MAVYEASQCQGGRQESGVRIITGEGDEGCVMCAQCSYSPPPLIRGSVTPVQLKLSISCIFRGVVVSATSYPILNFVTVSGSMLREQIKEGDG